MGLDAAMELGFQSLSQEVSRQSLPVEGKIPPWLDGALLRNGAALFEVGDNRVSHWFDGLAMVHRFSFEAGGVTYTNRFLRTDAYRSVIEDGTIPTGFATGGSYVTRLWNLVFGTPTDNTNVHVARFGDEFVALTEVPRYVAFDPVTLETRGEFRFADDLSGTINCAHVIPDPHRGETIGLLTEFGRRHTYRFFRVPKGSRRRELIADLSVEKPAYVHSFSLTRNYVVLTEHPYRVNPRSFFLPGGESFTDHFDYEPERGTKFHVIDRETGDVAASIRTNPFFVFHHANAFERSAGEADGNTTIDDCYLDGDAGREIVVDLVSYPDDRVLSGLYLDAMANWFRSGTDGQLWRFRLPLDDGRVESRLLYDGIEFPQVPRLDRTRPHRYVYGQGAAEADGNHLAKVDCETGETARWEEPGVFVEEPIVVRSPAGTPASDDGVVLVTALNTTERRTDLLVFDAEALVLQARAPLPHVVPFGFHGRYVHVAP